MENYQNESNDLEDTIVDNEFIHPMLKNINNYSNPKIISFITEYMSLPLNEKIARYLINKNIREIKNPLTSDSLMHYLCINDENFPLLKLIKPNSKEMELKNNMGQTLLHIAVQNKSYKILKYLIENGSNLQSKDNKNNTPLIIAINNSDYNAVELIMKYNSTNNILNNNNKSILGLSKKKNDKVLSNVIKNIEEKNKNDNTKNTFINSQRNEYLYRGISGEINTKSSVNNCSLDTKNETDNQSLNIYKKKIISKDSKNTEGKGILNNKTISLKINFNKKNATPEKKCSYNSVNKLSPITYRTRLVYRRTGPKIIDKKDSYIEFDKDSNLELFESNQRHFSPLLLRKGGYSTSFSFKNRENDLINNLNKINGKNIINELNNCEIEKPTIKIINYENLNNIKDNRVKSQKNNISLKSLKDLDDYKVKKVRNTFIQKTPFITFKKGKKEDLSKEKLLEFLKEIGMQHYFQIFIKEGFDDINLILKQMKQGFPLLGTSLKEIGIISPGDRAKILIRMQEISGGFSFDFPFEQVYFKNNRSIQKWLNREGLQKYINNFIDSGYQSLELLLVQMASRYKINEKILKCDLNIVNDEDRNKIMKSLEDKTQKYVYELTKNHNVQRTYSKMVQNNNSNLCSII